MTSAGVRTLELSGNRPVGGLNRLLRRLICELDHTEDEISGRDWSTPSTDRPVGAQCEGKGGDIWIGGSRLVTKAGRIA